MKAKNKSVYQILCLDRRIKDLQWKYKIYRAGKRALKVEDKSGLLLFDTSLESLNCGDKIIELYCAKVIQEIFSEKEPIRVGTHVCPSGDDIEKISSAQLKIVCGTNLMSPHYEEFSNWKMPEDLYGYKDIITFGVGWGYYCDEISKTSKYVYQRILSQKWTHSVRDSYTEMKFHQMGIHNVINTGCPTLWGLTPEWCENIPVRKSRNVVTTITDYSQDILNDKKMIDILKEEYDTVYVWIQGSNDLEYLKQITDLSEIKVIPNELDKFTELLNNESLDYVGTRLHAGIHALNCGVRSIIIAIDNRAIEIGNDVNLPVIIREDIESSLRNKINSEFSININLHMDSINKWKEQFKCF